MEVSSVETDVFAVLELKAQPVQEVQSDILQQILKIRNLCLQADKVDLFPNGGQLGWRRGPANTQTSGRPTTLPNRWRGQGGSIRPPQKPGTPQQERAPQEKSQQRYVSKYQNSDSPVEDKILNQVILNKLNKFSSSNYDEVKAFLQQILDSDEKEFLRDFMTLVFKKAACEPTFCPLYARMISELSEQYTSLRQELESLYTRYLEVFEEVSEQECKDYETFVQRNREKLHRLGYSQFLSELTSQGVLELAQLQVLFTTILQHIQTHSTGLEGKHVLVEEYVDCLIRMTKAFQNTRKPVLVSLRTRLANVCEPIITDILSNKSSKFPGLSKKASFGLMDCLDGFRGT
jgi:hypothetical protein